jgi:hypothetical protein
VTQYVAECLSGQCVWFRPHKGVSASLVMVFDDPDDRSRWIIDHVVIRRHDIRSYDRPNFPRTDYPEEPFQ